VEVTSTPPWKSSINHFTPHKNGPINPDSFFPPPKVNVSNTTTIQTPSRNFTLMTFKSLFTTQSEYLE
jgi:hypothetical protein